MRSYAFLSVSSSNSTILIKKWQEEVALYTESNLTEEFSERMLVTLTISSIIFFKNGADLIDVPSMTSII